MKRVGILLIAVALIVGMIGCAGNESRALAIVSTEGGSVTDPGEGMFTYEGGTVVNLVAEAHEGYHFVNWTGDVDTVANVNAAITTITMNGSYFIKANFVALYDLTISSTVGGAVAVPGEGTFTYDANTVVSLNATPDSGYHCAKWTGDVSTIADVNAAATNITMNGDYSITANFASGIPLWDWNDLDAIRDNLGGNYTLMNDLDSTTVGYEELASPTANERKGWQPIGTVSIPIESPDDFLGLTGTLDGQGYEILDLFINRPDENSVGLFGAVNIEGVIKDIGVVNTTVIGELCVGSLVAGNAGSITNCYAAGTVSGDAGVGGLVGVNYFGTMSNSYATSSVTGEDYIGGLVGYIADGTVSNSYAKGSVTGIQDVGGLVGSLVGGTVSNSYSTGSVTGGYYVGGLVGFNGDTVSNSYSTGSVTGSTHVGGLVGLIGVSAVYDSFWDTQTSGQSTPDGGTGKTTSEMQDIATFTDIQTEGLDEPWDIVAVANAGIRNLCYIWNIVDDETYPFLSWEPVS